jgi:hypothetical protein
VQDGPPVLAPSARRRRRAATLYAQAKARHPRPAYTDYLTARVEALPAFPATVLLREITTLKDFVRPLRAERRRLAVLTVRFETTPGEQMQLDWGGFHRLPDGRKFYGLSSAAWDPPAAPWLRSRWTAQSA